MEVSRHFEDSQWYHMTAYSSHDLLLSKGLHVCSSSHFNARHVFMHLSTTHLGVARAD